MHGWGQTGTPPVTHWFTFWAGAPPSNPAPLQSATFFGWRGFPPFVVGWLLAAPPVAGDPHDIVLAPPSSPGMLLLQSMGSSFPVPPRTPYFLLRSSVFAWGAFMGLPFDDFPFLLLQKCSVGKCHVTPALIPPNFSFNCIGRRVLSAC